MTAATAIAPTFIPLLRIQIPTSTITGSSFSEAGLQTRLPSLDTNTPIAARI
ncbi:hypothetical protein LV779_12375 [Streptomyces thinghirensis]|nr:hypothetical protein [Streptomyces thinghirensis]